MSSIRVQSVAKNQRVNPVQIPISVFHAFSAVKTNASRRRRTWMQRHVASASPRELCPKVQGENSPKKFAH
jgi:hypothetical protein